METTIHFVIPWIPVLGAVATLVVITVVGFIGFQIGRETARNIY